MSLLSYSRYTIVPEKKYELHGSLTLLNFFAHAFFKNTTSALVAGLHYVECEKSHPKSFKGLVDSPEYPSKYSSPKIEKHSVHRMNRIHASSFST